MTKEIVIKCDRCGDLLAENKQGKLLSGFSIYTGSQPSPPGGSESTYETFDLCDSCIEALLRYMLKPYFQNGFINEKIGNHIVAWLKRYKGITPTH